MKQIGEMDMKFKKGNRDIHYYDVAINIGGNRKKIVLPRYHIMLGWVEVFGFPPQQEWVVLADIKPFTKKAMLSVNSEDIKEKVDFNLNKKEGFHEIITTRELGDLKEIFTWTEDYTNAPESIKDAGKFVHNDGVYKYTVEKNLITKNNFKYLTKKQKTFVGDITNKHGEPDAIWRKVFKARGVIPSLFYKMFPIVDNIDLTNIKGSIVEVGYLEKEGEGVDRAHGDWYKLIELNDQDFFIEEKNYSSLTIKIGGKKQTVKGTYSKKLYRI